MTVPYADFTESLDEVPHNPFLQKLSEHGVGGCLLKPKHSYTSDQKQYSEVGLASLALGSVTSGVSRGSTLGSVLFLIFVRDLAEVAQSDCHASADHFRLILSSKNENECSVEHFGR